MFNISNIEIWSCCSVHLLHWTCQFFCRMHSSPSLWAVLSGENQVYRKLRAHHRDILGVSSSCLWWGAPQPGESVLWETLNSHSSESDLVQWSISSCAVLLSALPSWELVNLPGKKGDGKQRASHSPGNDFNDDNDFNSCRSGCKGS